MNSNHRGEGCDGKRGRGKWGEGKGRKGGGGTFSVSFSDFVNTVVRRSHG